jgi:hypothetical protein
MQLLPEEVWLGALFLLLRGIALCDPVKRGSAVALKGRPVLPLKRRVFEARASSDWRPHA